MNLLSACELYKCSTPSNNIYVYIDNIEGFGNERKRENEVVARERFVESRKGRKWDVFEGLPRWQ